MGASGHECSTSICECSTSGCECSTSGCECSASIREYSTPVASRVDLTSLGHAAPRAPRGVQTRIQREERAETPPPPSRSKNHEENFCAVHFITVGPPHLLT